MVERISWWMPLFLMSIYSMVRDLVWVSLSWCLEQWQHSARSGDITGEKQSLECKEIPWQEERTVQIPSLQGSSASQRCEKSASPLPATPHVPQWLLLVPKASRTHSSRECTEQADTYTGLKAWPTVTEISGSLHYRELRLFPFPQLLVLVLI